MNRYAGNVSNELVNAIVQMKHAGYSEREIVQALKDQGYTPQEIDESMNLAEENNVEPYMPPPPSPTVQSSSNGGDLNYAIESIVEDKLRSVSKDIGELDLWKDKVDSRLDKLEQSMGDLKTQVVGLNKAIIGKIEEYEKNLLDVGTEIKAMQKVFKDSLPELTKSIEELSRVTKRVKGK